MYGGGDLKLGQILSEDPNYKDLPHNAASLTSLGKKMRKKFLEGLPALKKLTDAAKKKTKERGYLVAVDGRRLPSPSQHSALNTLLQGAGAIVMKRALVIFKQLLEDEGLEVNDGYNTKADVSFLLNVHDEYQTETLPEHGKVVGECGALAIRLAGNYLRFRCPLSGSYDIGRSWKETH